MAQQQNELGRFGNFLFAALLLKVKIIIKKNPPGIFLYKVNVEKRPCSKKNPLNHREGT